MDSRSFEEGLSQFIRPGCFPIAVKMLAAAAEIPEKSRRPKQDMGIEVAICQAMSMARRYGWTLALSREDVSCPLTLGAFGFAPLVPFSVEGHACAGIYASDLAVGARTEAAVPKLAYRQYEAMAIAPLARTTFTPDVVIVYGNSAQINRLVQGALYHGGGNMTSHTQGRLDCTELVIRPLQTGLAQFVLPCAGDRFFALTFDDEMAFTLPWARAEEILEGLRATHAAGIRYPTPTFLRFTAQYPAKYNELMEHIRMAEEQGTGNTA